MIPSPLCWYSRRLSSNRTENSFLIKRKSWSGSTHPPLYYDSLRSFALTSYRRPPTKASPIDFLEKLAADPTAMTLRNCLAKRLIKRRWEKRRRTRVVFTHRMYKRGYLGQLTQAPVPSIVSGEKGIIQRAGISNDVERKKNRRRIGMQRAKTEM